MSDIVCVAKFASIIFLLTTQCSVITFT